MNALNENGNTIRRRRVHAKTIESDDNNRLVFIDQEIDKYQKYNQNNLSYYYFSQFINYIKLFLYRLTRLKRFEPTNNAANDSLQNLEFEDLSTISVDELFAQLLHRNQYSEALDLASIYSLDCDVVYQRMWRNNPITSQTIDEYLSKISKSLWALRECVECVAADIDDMKYLLEFGLSLTEKQINMFLGNQRKLSATQTETNSLLTETNEDSEVFDSSVLTIEEKQIFNWRQRLLHYFDRLTIYEMICESDNNNMAYDYKFYESFRNMSAFEASIYFARDSRCDAISLIFTYEGEHILDNRLIVLSNFPETTTPKKYSSLIPMLRPSKEKGPEVYPWNRCQLREDDWCDKYFIQLGISLANSQFETDFYADNTNLLEYRTDRLTKALVSKWFCERARQILSMTSLVSHSLELIELGIENNVPSLEKLHHEFDIYALLIYESNCDNEIDFESFEKLSNIEKLNLIMSEATKSEEQFLIYIEKFLKRFIAKVCKNDKKLCETVGKKLFHDYLVGVAPNHLNLCLLVFQKSSFSHIQTDDEPNKIVKIIEDPSELIEIALDCVYECDDSSQLINCFKIIDCLPEREYISYLSNNDSIKEKRLNELSDCADKLEKHLVVCEMIEQYDTPPSLRQIRNFESHSDRDGVKLLFTKVTRNGAKKLVTANQWMDLFNCMQDVRQSCFADCISEDELFEIFVQTILCSGRRENFNLAATYMQLNSEQKFKKKVIAFSKSKKLLLNAAQEYVNSSDSVLDNNILLAKECFKLIDEIEQRRDAAIAEELDFIEALHLIHDYFPVKLLPIQIRLIPQPRIEIIEKLLKFSPKSYTKTWQIQKIANLLRVCDNCGESRSVDDYRSGAVLSMIANAAFEVKDFNHCFNTCKTIMSNNYSVAWKVCLSLGLCELYDKFEERLELLCFALTYCDQSEDLLQLLSRIREFKIKHDIPMCKI